MIPSSERALAHAAALRARGGTPCPDGPPALIVDSWARALRAGLDFAAPLTIPVIGSAELAQRRERSALLRRLAQAELETLSQQIAGSNFLLAFADREGVILDLYTDNRFSMSGSDSGIVVGSCWREDLFGTNGLGTALACGQSVAVSGPEHYSLQLGGLYCTATPVRDAKGEIVGMLDASSYFESRQLHTQALVQMAATHMENALLVRQMRPHLVLAIHPRAEYLATLSAGLLAFDAQGRLQALNSRAQRLLAGLDAVPGALFEALFGVAFDLAVASLQVGHELRLRDTLGSALVASVVNRPPPVQRRATEPAPRQRAAAADATAATPLQPARPQRPAARGRASVGPAGFVTDDPAVAQACLLVQVAVRMAVPILILGETGSGKEMLARHAHLASGRRGDFVAVNCGALPDDLFEAELFGHVGGAFTGARREGSLGLIASADGGTLLLDEVRELPLHLQAALLRFLDDRLVRPVGGTAARRVDVQLLAASNVDLEAEVAARRFRADLFYRLNVVKVVLPPLRLRGDFDRAVGQVLAAIDPGATLSAAALRRLAEHDWPGNFRELQSVLTRALLVRRARDDDARIELADLAHQPPGGAAAGGDAIGGAVRAGVPGSALRQSATDLVLREFERCHRSVSRTSRSLGISRTTVYRHLREAGLAQRSGS